MSTSIGHLHLSLVHHHPPPMSPVGRSLWREIIESTRDIFKSHIGHFHAISILFLLPIVFSIIVYPSFHLAIFHPDYDFTSFPQLQFSNIEITVLIVYTLFLSLFFICGVGTTTYSAVQTFYDRPINLVSSIKSIRNSFFPLLSTFISEFSNLSGLKHDLNDHLSFVVIFALIVFVPVLIWLQVNWSLAYVIAVKDYETQRRRANLVKGKRWIAFGILMYYGLAIVLMVVGCSIFLVSVDAAKGDQWRSQAVMLQTVLGSVLGYVLMNQYLVANMVLYMYCKELNSDENLVLQTGGE
ncbi:hypothetical protein P3S68_022007 [Capsicum galapagoense]